MKQAHIASRSALGLAAILATGHAPAIVLPNRALVLDNAMTFDAAMLPTAPLNASGDMRGKLLDHRYPYMTADGRAITVDSTGAFLIGELERLDQTLHMPLAAVTWTRDINLREDVT